MEKPSRVPWRCRGHGQKTEQGLGTPFGSKPTLRPSAKEPTALYSPMCSPFQVLRLEDREGSPSGQPLRRKKRGRAVAAQVVELVERAGIEIAVSYSAYSGHLVTMASALVVGDHDIIAVVGGDGSLSEAITGRMLLNGKRTETFAIVPAGTGNSSPRSSSWTPKRPLRPC